jgi:hypothetical protein
VRFAEQGGDMANNAFGAAPSEAVKPTSIPFKDEVEDATLVLDYAIANGIVDANNNKLDDKLIVAIKQTQDWAARDEAPPAELRASFEIAYRDLAIFVAPVTAETLKATSDAYPARSVWNAFGHRPISIVWSRKLSLWAILFIVTALTGSFIDAVNPPLPYVSDRDASFPTVSQCLQIIAQLLVPFTYGAIGASVALLKACQAYIHQRQFDARRIPEYYNRMILGAISGGMIVLLVNQISDDDGTSIKLSAAALGFLAGYNNDLLFSAIERISAAILPKVGLDTVQRDKGGAAVTPVDAGALLPQLIEQYKNAATDAEKQMIAALIQKIQDKL